MRFALRPISVRRFRRATAHRALAVLLAVLQGGVGFCLSPPAARAADPPAARPLNLDRGDFEQGLEVALVVSHELGLEEDEAALDRIYDIGSRIALAADDPSTVTSFYLVKMAEPNAFAVPGGFIFITRGLLDLDLSDDALAHLLGHEITHVRNRHASRMGTWAAISSILQTALVIGLAIGASGGGRTTTVDEYGIERVSTGGSAAAIEGAAVFSSVFRELFLRGFSRRLEAEADENGYRLATRAGYDPMGGVELLEGLHQRIFEDTMYGYWRTHPYFSERVVAARARAGNRVGGPDSSAVSAYRMRVQSTLVREARRQEGLAADLLYRSALRAGPERGGAAAIELELVQLRAAREREKPLLMRELGPIVTAADSAIARLERLPAADPGDLAKLEAERKALQQELDGQETEVVAVLSTPGAASNATLEVFLRNYPHHPRAPEVRLGLARRYLRAEEPEDAIPLLTDLLASADTPDSLRATGHHELERAIAATRDLSACYSLVAAPPDTELGAQAAARMEVLVAKVDSLENGGRFLKRWPETPYTDPVRERVSTLATASARFARVYEVGGKPQQALDLYNRVVLLAPGTPAANEAMRGIERIQGVQPI